MQASEAIENPVLRGMVSDLKEALGDRLQSIVLYGSAARGDFQKGASDFNLFVVIDDLSPESLDVLSPIISRWVRRGHPYPRLFSPQLINDSTDVFPVEFVEIRTHHVLLHGADPVENIHVDTDRLRLSCEREFREKMMRLREAYMEAGGKSKALKRLLVKSYSTFVAVFRGCLHLLGGDIPAHNDDVVEAFCRRAELDRSPFDTVGRLKKGDNVDVDMASLFSAYYGELTKATHRIDRFVITTENEAGSELHKRSEKGGFSL